MRTLFPLLFALVSLALAVDEIKDLPGLTFEPKFKQYSGYLKASETRHVHYWFVESQNDPATAPLLFWFNGGPGCSSLLGLLGEHGPYLLNWDNSTLRENPYAWNKFANVVYMESPARVGFAYADASDDHDYSDNRTSLENYEAVKQFLEKFPQFRNSPVFLVGESYGGIFVPTLAARILEGQKDYHVNLTGIAIGNGWVDTALQFSTTAQWRYAHNMLDEGTWKDLKKCCKGDVDVCDVNTIGADCRGLFESEAWVSLSVPGINVYDVYRNCETHTDMQLRSAPAHLRRSGEVKPPSSLPSCDPFYGAYLNRKDVRSALNIPEALPDWHMCNSEIYDAYGGMDAWQPSVRGEVQKALASGVRVLLFYGDTDAACNALLGQKFAASLGHKQDGEWKAWMYGAAVGGFRTYYEGGLSFFTVRGAGHMAAQWKPAETQLAIRSFLANKRL